MNFSPIKIFSYGLTGNSCFDECLCSMQQDNDVFGYSAVNNVTFNNVMDSVSKHFDVNPSAASLAVLGLFDYAIRNQLKLESNHLKTLIKAKNSDPLSVYSDRQTLLRDFDKQLYSYISDQGMQTNEYCI